MMKWTSDFASLLISLLVSVASIDGQTQAEMNKEARADFARADAELNKTYQTVLAKLSAAERLKLKETQLAWVASRDTEAADAAKEAEGGSMAATLRYETMTELTRKRITELKAMIDEGTASGTKTEAPKTENKRANSVSESEPTSPRPPPPEKPSSDQEQDAAEEDSSRGLPQDYAKHYLIAGSTISPDKKKAVIYPTLEAWEAADTANHPERIKDYLVGLQPFQVLKQLDTKWPYFQNENHGGISGEWSDDSSIALITLDAKWGPRDVFLAEFRDGKLSRITNIACKAHYLLLPNYRKSRTRYHNFFDFVFVEDASFKLEGTSVLIDASAETSPPSDRGWRGHVEAVWDIAQAKFTSTKVSGGIRRRSEETSD